MRRWCVAALLLTAACAGADDTRLWSPGAPLRSTVAAPTGADGRAVAPEAGTVPRIDGEEALPREPGVTSKVPLSPRERRTLDGDRQYLNAEIETLERRARFDEDPPRATDESRLRRLKARKRSVLRRLRGP